MAAGFLFQVVPTSGLPIYRQLLDQVRRHVATRRLRPGDFLPSVRQVALELEVNPMTVSKAYSLLERDGVVELVRGQGMRVAESNGRAAVGSVQERQRQLLPLVEQVVAEGQRLALSATQIK